MKKNYPFITEEDAINMGLNIVTLTDEEAGIIELDDEELGVIELDEE